MDGGTKGDHESLTSSGSVEMHQGERQKCSASPRVQGLGCRMLMRSFSISLHHVQQEEQLTGSEILRAAELCLSGPASGVLHGILIVSLPE